MLPTAPVAPTNVTHLNTSQPYSKTIGTELTIIRRLNEITHLVRENHSRAAAIV